MRWLDDIADSIKDREAWLAAVHGVTKSQDRTERLKNRSNLLKA